MNISIYRVFRRLRADCITAPLNRGKINSVFKTDQERAAVIMMWKSGQLDEYHLFPSHIYLIG